MTEKDYEEKLNKLDKEVHEVWEKSFDMPSYQEAWNWYNNHPKVKEYGRLYREYKLIKTPILFNMDDLDKECHMKFDTFEISCRNGFFSDYDGSGVYATKDEVSDIKISPSDITSGVYRKDFDYVCWYNK